MNVILSLIVSVLLGASATPTNPVIAEFIKVSNEQTAQTGMSASFENTIFGDAVVVSQPIPIDSSMFPQIPTDDLKAAFIKELKSDKDAELFLKVLKESNTNLIVRLVANDGNSYDMMVTSADL